MVTVTVLVPASDTPAPVNRTVPGVWLKLPGPVTVVMPAAPGTSIDATPIASSVAVTPAPVKLRKRMDSAAVSVVPSS